MKAKNNANVNANANINVDIALQALQDVVNNWGLPTIIERFEKLLLSTTLTSVDNGTHSTKLEPTFTDKTKSTVEMEKMEVEFVDFPNTLTKAVQIFGSFDKLIDNATAYVIAHSLLPKARDVRKCRYQRAKESSTAVDFSPIQLKFETPKARGEKVAKVDIAKAKGDNKDIEAFKALALKLGFKVD